jgi:hypothetical protein
LNPPQQNGQAELLINNNLSPIREDINGGEQEHEILPWIEVQIAGDQQHEEALMMNDEGSPAEDAEENSANDRDVVAVQWPQEWVKLKNKNLEDAFFAYYSLKLAELYEAFDNSDFDTRVKNNVKNTWCVIKKAVGYMKYFARSEILAPPTNGSPMQIAQWKRSLATIARDAQERTVQHLIDSKLRKRKSYSLSGNVRIICNLPRPANRVPVRDYLTSIDLDVEEGDADEIVEPGNVAEEEPIEEEPLPSLLRFPIEEPIEDCESEEEEEYVPISLEEQLLRSIERDA